MIEEELKFCIASNEPQNPIALANGGSVIGNGRRN
jgi:hypothetical protein